jgi:hypothetical protein
MTRPREDAARSWAAISLELRVFKMPEVKVTVECTRKIVVSKKWIFLR